MEFEHLFSVCVTHLVAEAVRRLEGTMYVTISLVMPAIYKLLGKHAPATNDKLDLYLSLAQERKDICVLA